MRWTVAIWIALAFAELASGAREHVILLHGLARTDRSMVPMKAALEAEGYVVLNVGYPSRTATIRELSERAIGEALAQARRDDASVVHFVTHSLGGILVRSYLARHAVPELGRVVMLGPPNRGSELVDVMGDWALFNFVNGPAGRELGTASDAVPNRLGPMPGCLGIVAGNRSINWINSLLIPGPDDGKVSVEHTKLEGMTDHIVVPGTHPFLMREEQAIRQTIAFLREGRFARSEASGAPAS